MTTKIQLRRAIDGGMEDVVPVTSEECVMLNDGRKLTDFVSSVENDEFSPTITQVESMAKVGVGTDVDVSANVQEGYVKSAILKGNTKVNLIQEPSSQDVVLPYEFTEGQSVTINDTKEAGALGVELKGQTLVNILQSCKFTLEKTEEGKSVTKFIPLNSLIKPSSKYLYVINVKKNTLTRANNQSVLKHCDSDSSKVSTTTCWEWMNHIYPGFTGVKKYVMTTKPVFEGVCELADRIEIFGSTDVGGMIEFEIFVIEYQEGMENWDIPYFEGMQSVKMPVLKATGKNLFDYSSHPITLDRLAYIDGQQVYWTGYIGVKTYVPVKENTTYTYSNDINVGIHYGLVFYDDNKSVLSYINNFKTNNSFTSFTTPKGCKFIRFAMQTQQIPQWIQLEESPTPTTYEPYKSNILSCNSEVVLRSLPNGVCDTLDLMTGEYVQRIGEVVLDGSEDENWELNNTESTSTKRFAIGNFLTGSNITNDWNGANKYICDKIHKYLWSDIVEFGITVVNNAVFLYNNNIDYSIGALKTWLSQNPVTIQYELAEPITTTIDLVPSGTNPTTKPFVWKDGHIQLLSEQGTLTPSLEYGVITSRGGQILDNTRQITKQDKRIYDLEMLLISSSVEDAYQRLALQNTVQLANYSVSEESTSNPIRYYMLSRLIEEGMYQESDILNKLDTFFLYGEITLEQYYELVRLIVGDNAIATLDEVLASHEIQVDIPTTLEELPTNKPTTLEEEVLPSDIPTTLEEQPIIEEVEETPIVELKDYSKTYTLLMNKLELSIQRVEDLARYVDLANVYVCANRLSYEEYELVIARIENAYISLH